MWGKSAKLQELEQKIKNIVNVLEDLRRTVDSITSSVANIRGIINRKLYSGKLKEDEPSWLKNQLQLVGISETDKNHDGIGM